MDHKNHYRKLILMALSSLMAMYVLMYAMVNTFSNIFLNYNQLYMAGIMAVPMVVIELWLMRPMYQSRKINTFVILISLILFLGFFAGIRQQIAINDEQFLKSMIPHHAGAILMCSQAKLKDTEIKKLCQNILSSQQSEINFMKSKLDELSK